VTGATDVPLRRSLLLRLLAASAVIAMCAIGATAWLVMRGTTQAIQQQQVRAYANDTRLYDALVGYAATHTSWDGAQPFLDGLTAGTDRRITLTTPGRQVLAGTPVTGQPAASVDPLHVDPAVLPDAHDQIDERAIGPYMLNDKERADQRTYATEIQQCVRQHSTATTVQVEHPNGIVTVATNAPAKVKDDCQVDYPTLTSEVKRSLDVLSELADICLRRQTSAKVSVQSPVTWAFDVYGGKADPAVARACVADARRQQLMPYVAPPVLMFIHSPDKPATTGIRTEFPLSRVAGVAALVMLVTVAVTALVGFRLIRPLRALIAAARHPAGTQARVPVRGRDEIGVLAAALNHESERRERAEAQRKAMVSDIAHELRTPLTNIRSWLEAAEDGLAAPVSDPQLATALLTEAVQLQRIIDDLQDLAAADAGVLRLDRRPVAAAELVRQAVTAHRGSADAAGVRLVEDIGFTGVVDADPVRLTQALGNLIGNAVRYTPAGGLVTVSTVEHGGAVLLRVADTGPGIAPEDLPRVFDRFWRADPSRTRDTGGSGLGLAIVKPLVEAHGGTVSVTSDEHGATFTVRL
jgi:two-component system sensor histidine kinase BaeS